MELEFIEFIIKLSPYQNTYQKTYDIPHRTRLNNNCDGCIFY